MEKPTEQKANIVKADVEVLTVSDETPAAQQASHADGNHAATEQNEYAGSLMCIAPCCEEGDCERQCGQQGGIEQRQEQGRLENLGGARCREYARQRKEEYRRNDVEVLRKLVLFQSFLQSSKASARHFITRSRKAIFDRIVKEHSFHRQGIALDPWPGPTYTFSQRKPWRKSCPSSSAAAGASGCIL
ncbi:MAG: hypothetical protein ABSG21_14190 [Spirochaetia bacterium]